MSMIWDIETFPNCFTLAAEHSCAPLKWMFEISEFRDDTSDLFQWCEWLARHDYSMVGFNNIGFDYIVLHAILSNRGMSPGDIYRLAMDIIEAEDDDKFKFIIYPDARYIKQIDLMRVHHMDNKSRRTSLKKLEFAMRLDNVCTMPVPFGTRLTKPQIEVLKQYNENDVHATKQFYKASAKALEFRNELNQEYGRDFSNHSDVGIGKDFFVSRLEAAGIACYDYSSGRRAPKQTIRKEVALDDAILKWIKFDHPEFTRIINWLRGQVVTETKGVFKDLTATVDGLTYVFGMGGIHASVNNRIYESDADHLIVDIDVEGYYPSTGIVQGFRPAHYPKEFSDIWRDIKHQRSLYKKGTAKNGGYKLAANGAFGDMNSPYSVFYDTLAFCQITLNGQMLMCLLIEKLILIEGLEVIQANTDGITVYIKREVLPALNDVVAQWEKLTQLKMEHANYSKMFIRDVNNYIAVYEDGTIKRKGAYDYAPGWHQDHGMLVVAKAAEQVLLHGKSIRETVENWPDIYDFMKCAVIPKSSRLFYNYKLPDQRQLENTQRYYVSTTGGKLTKVMPPLPKRPGVERPIGIVSDWAVCPCNDISDANQPIDYDYYVQEVEKLCLCLA